MSIDYDQARITLAQLLRGRDDPAVEGLMQLTPHERLFLINTCCMVVIEYVICNNHDREMALHGVRALFEDAIGHVEKLCANNKRREQNDK
jgi:hypothetical protein